jgi:hypothetical protein
MSKYEQTMIDQIKEGVLERVRNPRLTTGPRVHYLAHQPVIKESSISTKLRIVFDASAGQPSLNECLARGPVYAGQNEKQIAVILIRVRLMMNVLCMDLEKAFLQVLINPRDRDVTRILWPKNPMDETDEFKVYRFSRVTFGLNCAPFLLGATVEHHLKQNANKYSDKLIRGSYVDNYIVEVKEPDEVPFAVSEIRQLFWKGGFNCRQFTSNCRHEINGLPFEWQEPRSKLSLLGIQWDTIDDTFKMKMPKFKGPTTKRSILSVIASFFDPNGWFSPILLQAKRLQAEVWKIHVDWDELIPEELESRWQKIVHDWDEKEFSIPRRSFQLSPSDLPITCEMHGFSDASEFGIGIAVYLRHGARRQMALVFARSLVIPTSLQPKPKKLPDGSSQKREISIPRLELQAAHLTHKVCQQLMKNLQVEISKVRIWTDSTTIIQWLRAGRHKEIFVENRLAKLRNTLICYVNTKENPADIASRGQSIKTFSLPETWNLWFHGPKWMSDSLEEWPETLEEFDPNKENVNNEETIFSIECAAIDQRPQVIRTETEVFDLSRFSNFYRLKRAVVYVLKNLRKLMRKAPSLDFWFQQIWTTISPEKSISVDELEFAELILVRDSQKTYPPNEITRRDLRIYEDERGILRCDGRLKWNIRLSIDAINPVYIPKNSPLVGLLLRDLHRRNHHCGPATLIALFREKYWTPQLRKVIRDYLFVGRFSKCIKCTRHEIKPFVVPIEPPLPAERMAESIPPFSHVGVDFFGPFRTKPHQKDSKESMFKTYGAIFACLTTRAVHLELCLDGSARSFLAALRRFISRRGTPRTILSDNALSFKASAEIVTKTWVSLSQGIEVQDAVTKQGIRWVFITERAPWRGAVYERLIGLVKHGLRRALGRSMVGFEELQTLLIECERIVNSRPLTFQSDSEIGIRALRPIDFLIPYNREPGPDFPSAKELDDPDPLFIVRGYTEQSREAFVHTEYRLMVALERFWEIWRKEYLMSLRERWRGTDKEPDTPLVGQVVIVEDDNLPRSAWSLAIVLEMTSSRTARIRIAPHNIITKRPINKLYPLEIEPKAMVDLDSIEPPEKPQEKDPRDELPGSDQSSRASTPEIQIERSPTPFPHKHNLRPREKIKPPKKYYVQTHDPNVTASNIGQRLSKLSLISSLMIALILSILFRQGVAEWNEQEHLTTMEKMTGEKHEYQSLGPLNCSIPRPDTTLISRGETLAMNCLRSKCFYKGEGGYVRFVTARCGQRSKAILLKGKPNMLVEVPFKIDGIRYHLHSKCWPSQEEFEEAYARCQIQKEKWGTSATASPPTIPWTDTTPPNGKWLIESMDDTVIVFTKPYTTKEGYMETRRNRTESDANLYIGQWVDRSIAISDPEPTIVKSVITMTARVTPPSPRILTLPEIGSESKKKGPDYETTKVNLWKTTKRAADSGLKFHPKDLQEADAQVFRSEKPLSYWFCKTMTYTLWRVPEREALCTHLPDIFVRGKKTNVTVYNKYSTPVPTQAYLCSRKTQKIKYYTNLFRDHFTNLTTTHEKLSANECKDFVQYKTSTDGALLRQGSTGLYSTNNALEVNFPGAIKGFIVGENQDEKTNSLLEEITIFLRPNTFGLSSPIYDLRHCSYENEACTVNDMTLIWKRTCEANGCQKCIYTKVGSFAGLGGPGGFISDDHQFALTFSKTTPTLTACDGQTIKVSDQGFAVLSSENFGLHDLKVGETKWSTRFHPGRTGGKRQPREAATTEQVAAEITAAEWSLLETMDKMFHVLCKKGSYMPDNPTIAARWLLQREDVMARWASPRLLQVYPCASIEAKEVRPRRTMECYKFVPVTYRVEGLGTELIDGFLDPRLNIISSSSPVSDCRSHQKLVYEDSSGVVETDSIEGTTKKILYGEIHQIPIGVGISGGELPLDSFHDLILTNDSDIFEQVFNAEHLDEHERAVQWQSETDVRQTETAKALSAKPHSLPGLVSSYFFGWLGVAHSIWINICATITTVFTVFVILTVCLPAGLTRAVSRISRWGTGARRTNLPEIQSPPRRFGVLKPPRRQETGEAGTSIEMTQLAGPQTSQRQLSEQMAPTTSQSNPSSKVRFKRTLSLQEAATDPQTTVFDETVTFEDPSDNEGSTMSELGMRKMGQKWSKYFSRPKALSGTTEASGRE